MRKQILHSTFLLIVVGGGAALTEAKRHCVPSEAAFTPVASTGL